MFVSSYSTYISSSNIEKNDRYKTKESSSSTSQSASFEDILHSDAASKNSLSEPLFTNYIASYRFLTSKEKFQQDFSNSFEYKKLNTQNSAKSAYEESTKPFSYFKSAAFTFDLTPKIDKNEPKEIQTSKEKALRKSMINTYIANDNYYRVTSVRSVA